MRNASALALSALLTSLHAAPVAYQDEAAFVAATVTQLEDFEASPWVPDSSYASPVTAAGATWAAGVELRASSFAPRSGAAALSDIDAPTQDPLDRIEALFDGLHDALGMALRSAGRGDLLIELLAADRSVLLEHRQTVFTDWVYLGWAAEGLAVAGLRVSALRDGTGFTDDFLIDDVRWGGLSQPDATVPEPGSALLVAFAMAAWRLVSRRARRPAGR